MSQHPVLFILSLFALLGPVACSSGQPGLFDFLDIRDFEDHRVEMEHPGGPIAEPEIPPELSREVAAMPELQKPAPGALSYRVRCEFSDESLDRQLRRNMQKAFERASILEKLRRKTPTDPAGLEQRMRSDLKVAEEVLHAYGFYTGDAIGNLRLLPPQNGEEAGSRYEVDIGFRTGVRYHLGKSVINITGEGARPPRADETPLPRSLPEVGLAEGTPVVADEVIAAVGNLRQIFRSRGYPFAEVTSSRYFLDHEKRVLETEIQVDSGEEARMGDFELRGTAPVLPYYFESLQNWTPGRPWNQDIIDAYRESLRQTGLFAGVEVYPSEKPNHRGERNVVVEVVGALERTLGGALRYASDLGPGVLGYWEHRNLSGRGDRLRFEIPIWEEKQELAAHYRLPFFHRPDQDFLMGGGVLHEDNDSYKLITSSGFVGFERRLNRHWSATARVRSEGGQIKEVDKKERDYYMYGLPLSLAFSDTRNPLDAVKGVRITLSAAPYAGYYEDYFTAIRTRLDANFFLPLIGRNTLVLALRGVYGSLFISEADEVPPSIRFYSGGGGSVRGYEYRSIGPRNESNDPLGGDSLVEFGAELRWRFAEDLGLVLFTDGGMVYTDKFPNKDDELLWGAGLGLRYYTLIGPIRFDAAFPVNKRGGDSSVQLYISIGQSF
jgi:translocation and assembly module TamA